MKYIIVKYGFQLRKIIIINYKEIQYDLENDDLTIKYTK